MFAGNRAVLRSAAYRGRFESARLSLLSFERTVYMGSSAVLMVIMLAANAFATVKPYVPSVMQNHQQVLESVVILSDVPPEPGDFQQAFREDPRNFLPTQQFNTDSLTQGILFQAAFEFDVAQFTQPGNAELALSKTVDYLQQSGVSRDLAEALIQDIATGTYQADQPVVQALYRIASQKTSVK